MTNINNTTIDVRQIEYLDLMNEANDAGQTAANIKRRQTFRAMEAEREHNANIEGREFKPVWHSWSARRHTTPNTPRAVRCVETGEVWPSARAAGKFLAMCGETVTKYLDSGKTLQGLTFVSESVANKGRN